jgi:hypothetical protein
MWSNWSWYWISESSRMITWCMHMFVFDVTLSCIRKGVKPGFDMAWPPFQRTHQYIIFLPPHVFYKTLPSIVSTILWPVSYYSGTHIFCCLWKSPSLYPWPCGPTPLPCCVSPRRQGALQRCCPSLPVALTQVGTTCDIRSSTHPHLFTVLYSNLVWLPTWSRWNLHTPPCIQLWPNLVVSYSDNGGGWQLIADSLDSTSFYYLLYRWGLTLQLRLSYILL